MNEIAKVGFDYKSIKDKDLRDFLRGEETAIRASNRRVQTEIIEIGERLIKAKERADHGTFMDWCEKALGYTHKHITGFMHVAKAFSKVEVTTTLPLSQSALFELAAPSVSDEKREEIIEKIEAKEIPPTVASIKAEITPKPELNQPSGRANRAPEVDHTDTAFPENPQIDAPPEVDGYGRPAQKFVEETHEVINPDLPDETPETVTTLKDLTQAEEDALSPEEWLAMLPLFDKLVLEKINSRLFCEAALNWRNMRKSYLTLRREVKANVNGAAPDAYSVRMRAAVSIPHPKDWTFSRGAAGGFIL